MANRVITLSGQVISDLISDTPGIIIQTGEYGQTVFAEIPSITGNNSDGVWDSMNMGSPLFGVDNYDNYEIDVLIDGQSVLNGSIKNVSANNKTRLAEIQVLTKLQKALQIGCIYTSGEEPETPAMAALNILDLYNIPYDVSSFANSNASYVADDVYIMVNLLTPEMTVLSVFQELCEKGLARIYDVNGVVYFDAFQVDYAPESMYTFSDRLTNLDGITIYDEPNPQLLEKEQILGYTVITAAGTVSDGPVDNNKGKTIDGGPDRPITIKDTAAGTSIGLRWVNYSQYRQNKIILGVPSRIANFLPLGTAVTIDYTSGKWLETLGTITGLDRSNPEMTLMTVVTV